MKKTIAILTLIIIPTISSADGGMKQDMQLGVDVSTYENTDTQTTNQPDNGLAISATSETDVNMNSDTEENVGLFRSIINWFKGWFN